MSQTGSRTNITTMSQEHVLSAFWGQGSLLKGSKESKKEG